MAKPVLDSLDGISKDFAAEYAQGADGKFYLSVDGFDNLLGMHSALEKTKKAKSELAAQLEAFRGIESERDKLKAKVEELSKGHKDDNDAARRQMVEAHNAEKAEFEKRIAALDGEINNGLLSSEYLKAASEHKAIDSDVVLMLAKNASRVETVNGKRVIRIVDADGETRYNSRGEPMSPTDFVLDLKTKAKPHLFEGGKPGAGSATAPGAQGGQKLSPAAQLQMQRKAMLGQG